MHTLMPSPRPSPTGRARKAAPGSDLSQGEREKSYQIATSLTGEGEKPYQIAASLKDEEENTGAKHANHHRSTAEA